MTVLVENFWIPQLCRPFVYIHHGGIFKGEREVGDVGRGSAECVCEGRAVSEASRKYYWKREKQNRKLL